MPTSELTDALNPFIGQQRQPQYPPDQHPYSNQSFHTQPHQSSFTPHRSELEYAISEPPPPPRYHSSYLSRMVEAHFSNADLGLIQVIWYKNYSAP